MICSLKQEQSWFGSELQEKAQEARVEGDTQQESSDGPCRPHVDRSGHLNAS